MIKIGTRKISRNATSRTIAIPPAWFENLEVEPTHIDLFITTDNELVIKPAEGKPVVKVEAQSPVAGEKQAMVEQQPKPSIVGSITKRTGASPFRWG